MKSLERDAITKIWTGKTWARQVRTPSVEESIQEYTTQIRSKYPAILLGQASDGRVLFREEDRTHIHVLGLPGQGKSKFLELLIRHDIDRLCKQPKSPGLCLIDSGDFGDTFQKVLRYCRKVGFTRVCVIDPNDIDGESATIPSISLFGTLKSFDDGKTGYTRPLGTVISSVRNSFRILWDTEDFTRTARITEYLKALTDVLYRANASLADLQYFLTRKESRDMMKREAILEHTNPNNRSRKMLDEVFAFHQAAFNNEFLSTVRRIGPAFEHPLPLIFGSNANPINFQKLLAEGWIILANLDPHQMDFPARKLLGTILVNEVIQAMYALTRSGRTIPFYLYIDEVGRYATELLAEVINFRRKANIRLVLAHQQFQQITNRAVRAAIKGCPVKVLFHADHEDRNEMVRMMYGGGLPLPQVDYILSGLAKQQADIKINKSFPRMTMLRDVPDIPPDKRMDEEFKARLYQQPWYKTQREIYDEINARFAPHIKDQARHASKSKPVRRKSREDTAPAEPGTPDDRGTDSPLTALRRKRGGLKSI